MEEAAVHTIHDVEEKVVHAVHDVEEKVIAAEHKVIRLTKDFLNMEASGGIFLMMAAVAAMIIANSPLYDHYHYLLESVKFRVGFTDYDKSFDAELEKSLLHWINDGMMAVFFFLVGLEIKREFVDGELSSRDRVLLPALAAVGGMAAPALIFWFINMDHPENLSGWAIPAATDIAFALGVVALLGSRVPSSVKVLLMAIAVIDDIGAIIIIALFYTSDIWVPPLFVAAAALVVLFILNRQNIVAKTPYFLASAVLWLAVFESGIHATLAGVVAALFIPIVDKRNPDFSPLKKLEHSIHPWVAFAILPLFAFANAGVSFAGMGVDDLFNPISLGIAAGLVIGKQIGVFSMLWLTIVTGLCPKPKDSNWVQLYAVSLLCGIGFTMSLFIGILAYNGNEVQAAVRIGVVCGSLVSAILGYVLLLYGTRPAIQSQAIPEEKTS
ncbi:MAG: Na+/H+ antiporter NhaA [Rhodospirillales bacterium]|nr:Na+/H+ antiporter NhaA [Rhodospirillales bacterium]